MEQALGQIRVQPATASMGCDRDHDLIDRLVEHQLLDGVIRIVPDGHRRDDAASCHRLELRQCLVEHALRFEGSLVALGMEQVQLGPRRVGYQHAELHLALRAPLSHGCEDLWRRGRVVRHHQDTRDSGLIHCCSTSDALQDSHLVAADLNSV